MRVGWDDSGIAVDARAMGRNQKIIIPISYNGPKRKKRYKLQISEVGLALSLIKDDESVLHRDTGGVPCQVLEK